DTGMRGAHHARSIARTVESSRNCSPKAPRKGRSRSGTREFEIALSLGWPNVIEVATGLWPLFWLRTERDEEVGDGVAPVLDDDGLTKEPGGFMPGHQGVLSGRYVVDSVFPRTIGPRVPAIRSHDDRSGHVGMQMAIDFDDSRLRKSHFPSFAFVVSSKIECLWL